jgi:hypothetical protein
MSDPAVGSVGDGGEPIEAEQVLDKIAFAMLTLELEKSIHKSVDDVLRVPSEVCRTYKRLLVSREAHNLMAEFEKVGLRISVANPTSAPLPAPTELAKSLAHSIVSRIAENAIRSQWVRTLWELEGNPDAEWPTEDSMVQDVLGLALGEDTGCLSEEDEDFRERVDVLWLEDLLARHLAPLPAEVGEEDMQCEGCGDKVDELIEDEGMNMLCKQCAALDQPNSAIRAEVMELIEAADAVVAENKCTEACAGEEVCIYECLRAALEAARPKEE